MGNPGAIIPAAFRAARDPGLSVGAAAEPRVLMSLPSLRRALPRPLAALALIGAALALTGCEQVEVIRSAPVAVTYDAHQGNNPLAAADAASLQEALRVRGEVWTIRIDTTPPSAGNVDVHNANAVVAARGRFDAIILTLTATAQGTIDSFSSRGAQDEQLFCKSLVQAIAQAGYTSLRTIHVEVYYNGSHHATLSWTAATNFVYKVLDNRA